jgi:hypothetical protein
MLTKEAGFRALHSLWGVLQMIEGSGYLINPSLESPIVLYSKAMFQT